MLRVSQYVSENMDALMSRYASIIPNPSLLREILHVPLPQTAWWNSLRVKREMLIDSFGQQAKALPWCEDGFRFDAEMALGKSWQYKVGLIQIQEEVSMLPVKCLQPTPNDCVLDMCAAPGNKTAQIAVSMQNQGTIVANDIHYQRLRALGQISQRLGLMNINIHVGDATSLPRSPGVFDKILVDAPCSCEGTLRKSQSRLVVPRKATSEHLAVTQVALLKKAIQLVKSGGRIVYSTCTFAPEENECVIDTILKQFAGEVELEDINLPHFIAEPGLLHWQGRQFAPSLAKTWRIWPHLNNTGGFFIAVLKKASGLSAALSVARPRFLPSGGEAGFVSIVQKRFAFESAKLKQYQYFMPSKRGIYATHHSNLALYENALSTFNFDSVGLFFIKTRMRYPKLSSAATLVVGQGASANRVTVNKEQLLAFLAREDVLMLPGQRMNCEETGYVIVKYNDIVIGLGLLFVREETVEWVLRSLYPRYW